MFITNNCASLHLWGRWNLVNIKKFQNTMKMISGIDNENFQYNLSKNESVEDEDENNEDQSYTKSTERSLKSRKEQIKVSIDSNQLLQKFYLQLLNILKKEKKQQLMQIQHLNSQLQITCRLWKMCLPNNMLNSKLKNYFCSAYTFIFPVTNSRQIAPWRSLDSVETVSTH